MPYPSTTILMAIGALLISGTTSAHAAMPRAIETGPYTLERSTTFMLTGEHQEQYAVFVALPEGEPPSGGWPVLYVLDGEDNFAIFALTARRLARAQARSGVSPGIVIGLAAGPLARRVRDYTPTVPGYRIPADKPASGLATGGSGQFLDLLSTAMTQVRHRWPVNETRETLAGHSFGGLIALHAAFARPELFDRVVAISPSFWFGDGLLAREASTASPPQARILVATGADEPGAAAGAHAFFAALGLEPSGGEHVELPGQSHGTTMLAAAPLAIRAAFARDKP